MIGWRKGWRSRRVEPAATSEVDQAPTGSSVIGLQGQREADDLDAALAAVLTLTPQGLTGDPLAPSLSKKVS